MKWLTRIKSLYLLLILSSILQTAYGQENIDSTSKLLSALPKITWVSPVSSNFSVKSAKINLKATIKSGAGLNSVLVYLNDKSAGEPDMKPSPNLPGSFTVEKSLTLSEGENIVYFVAANNYGSVISTKKSIIFQVVLRTFDSTALSSSAAPFIFWNSPSEKLTNTRSSKAYFKASVRSNSGLNSVLVYLNGVSAGEPQMSPAPNNIGSFIVEKTLTLSPGENSIFLEASNNNGTVKSELRYFDYQPVIKESDSAGFSKRNLPVISWTNPLWQNTALKSQDVSIKATVKSATGLNSVVVFLNGVLYGEPEMKPSPSVPGNFYITKTVRVNPGENNIYLVASNNIGETRSEKRYLTLPAEINVPNPVANQVEQKAAEAAVIKPPEEVPSITWTNPVSQGTTLNSPLINITAAIKSASGLNSVVLYLNGISAGEVEIKPLVEGDATYIIEKTIRLNDGENKIYLVATNSTGTSKSEIRNLTTPLVKEEPVVAAVDKNISKPVKLKNEISAPKSLSGIPVINWVSPSGPKTTMDSYNATVKANISSVSGLNSVLLYLNGASKGEADIKMSADSPGSFLVEKNVNFGPGENSIYLVVSTSEGITGKSEIRYFTNPSAILPEIKWATPVNPNSIVGTESFVISASIKSPTDLKSVKLYVNADVQSEDNIFDAAGAAEGNYNWENSVLLRKGENSIYIMAMNAAGSTRSEKRVIKFEESLTEKRLALVIGNSQYSDKPPLKNPVNDANLMAATLKELGFDVIKRLDAKREDMMGAIREFNEKLPEYSVALFYYAGHGNQVDGKNYLIPTNAVLEKPGDCKFEAIGVDFIVEEFERYPENTNIVILDACRDNPFASWSRGETPGFKPISFSSGTIVVFATSEGETAADGRGDNGLFTEALIKQMLVPQSIFSVVMKTRVEVRRLSNNQQTPMEWNKLNGDFYFKK